jgi:hypothetical protein
MCAQARPRYNNVTNSWWDGKLGIWPIGRVVPAQRNSCNRPAGTPIWENMSVTRRVYRRLLIDKLLPAIAAKFPNPTRQLRIQQDGAKSHILLNDRRFRLAALVAGLNVTIYNQPAQSPDLNLLDLGFFRCIQSYNDCCSKDAFGLIGDVERAYANYPRNKINYVWLSLQGVMNCIIDDAGGNSFKLPHMNKARLERLEVLPDELDVTDEAAPYLLEDLEL